MFIHFGLFVFDSQVDAVAPHLANSIGQDLIARCAAEVALIGVRRACARYHINVWILFIWPGGGRRYPIFSRLGARNRCRQSLDPAHQLQPGDILFVQSITLTVDIQYCCSMKRLSRPKSRLGPLCATYPQGALTRGILCVANLTQNEVQAPSCLYSYRIQADWSVGGTGSVASTIQSQDWRRPRVRNVNIDKTRNNKQRPFSV